MRDRARYTYIEHLKGARFMDQLPTTAAIQSVQHLNINGVEFECHIDQLSKTFLTQGYAIRRRQITTKITQEHQNFFTKLFCKGEKIGKNHSRSCISRNASRSEI